MNELGNQRLVEDLRGLPASMQHRMLLDLVRTHALAALRNVRGDDAREEFGPDLAFTDLGFDSLAAADLHVRLAEATGLRLPVTVAFDYPTPAILARRLRAELLGENAAAEPPVRSVADADDPIAIVGIGCRYPGGVTDPDQLWQVVAEGRDVIGPFPADRGWDLDGMFDPDPDAAGKSYVRHGGFLYDAAEFDGEFFGIGPREAQAMDPQQRLVLETSWEALERAGIDPTSLRGSRSGVFFAAEPQEYGPRLTDAEGIEGYLSTGNTSSFIAGRVAYTLGFEGPAFTVDTACSGSLVALHLAVRALRQGECTIALAGGVAVLAAPGTFLSFSRQRGLAPDGRCKPFSADADGTGWSEGAGVFVVERLSDAIRNGHPVLALVRGSAINSDGASNGLTAPNGPSQQRVIRQALVDAGLTPDQVDAVEAHGTGTTLGDPIEAQALIATYGGDRSTPLRLGSIKSNIGHTQAAAGAAGVIKMIMAMRHQTLPRTLHVTAPTPHVDWTAGDVELLTEAEPWPENGHPRRAGVSSFGFSGTNAHVILEQAPPQPVPPSTVDQVPVLPLPVSAKSPEALRAQADRLKSIVDEQVSLTDLGHALGTTRAHLDHRALLVAGDVPELSRGLDALAAGQQVPGVVQGRTTSAPVGFLFTGGGSQRLGMGRELYDTYPVFARAWDEICAEIDVHLDRPLLDVVWAEPGSPQAALLDEIAYLLPALFAIETAMFRLLESWGLRPDFLLGHSTGEIAAAHVAGVWSLPDAAAVITARGRLMQQLPREGGAMVSVQAAEEEVVAELGPFDGRAGIAAINGPSSVVLSGDEDAVTEVAATFAARGRKTKRLRVSHASHSPRMDPMLPEFRMVMRVMSYSAPRIPVVSALTGRIATAAELGSPDYWVNHVRGSVRFADGVRTLAAEGVRTFVELGPDPVLSAMAAECVPGEDYVFVPALRRGRAEAREITGALAGAWVRGADVDWTGVYGESARPVRLPTYAFQRRRFWLDSAAPKLDAPGLGQSVAGHPLLAAAVESAHAGTWSFTGLISQRAHPWVADHAINGIVLLPGTALAELALHAGDRAGCPRLADLTMHSPVTVPETGSIRLQVEVGAADERGDRQVVVSSRPADDSADQPWTRHATGVLSTDTVHNGAELRAWPPAGAEPVDIGDLYDSMSRRGYGYGPEFQGLRAAWRRGDEVFAEVALPEGAATGDFALSPALFDAALHAIDLGDFVPTDGPPWVPFAWTGVSLHAAGARALRVRLSKAGENTVAVDLADPTGAPVASVAALVSRPVTEQLASAGQAVVAQSLFTMDWTPVSPGTPTGEWALLGDGDVLGVEGLTVSCHTELSEVGTPDLLVVPWEPEGTGPRAARTAVQRILGLLQEWLADERFARSRLALVSSGDDLATAAVRGLVRSAQAEHPGRITLIDVDSWAASGSAIAGAVACGQPEVAIRGGELRVPRLARATGESTVDWDADGTVLVTGGLSGLGALVAHHLVQQHGVRHLLLVSRRGSQAPGAEELRAELSSLGATVTVAACDVSDRAALAELLAGIPAEHPLRAVVHAAGVLDDGVLASQTPERIDRVFQPKADAAWHLHELTADLDLTRFVLFSSTATMLDGAGQANYAAANMFLEALAARRRTAGLPATAVAWALWDIDSEMTGGLGEAGRRRFARSGFPPLAPEEGLALFDAALATGETTVAAVRIDQAALRGRPGGVPALLTGVVRPQVRRAAGTGAVAESTESLADRLATLSAPARRRTLLNLVRSHVAAVLGYDSQDAVDANRGLLELGVDSLAAVELRNRLGAAAGMTLPSTLIFDHPTSQAVADELGRRLVTEDSGGPGGLEAELGRLEDLLGAGASDGEEHERVAARLRGLLAAWDGNRRPDGQGPVLDSATAEELFEILDNELEPRA
ncbi:type I polyketide synthase [Kibdelosporangium persicum]|uniref:Malonyl CoA-acyl carrier protein transacylase n=1 Tax=Kibdelosporangium persicum TaxID=2698649 RepID=A0ABX2F7P8_9PSEU|nr:type I polyketide synthase [Kibdelosporangium persicum]NRN67297.1 Malonyl CoA-acyl carrier protein transacylase [Kibdelosporangium persicum]